MLHLLWVVPLLLVVTYAALVFIVLSWCGVSGCSGGGFGRVSEPWIGGTVAGGAIIALAWFTAVFGLRWHSSVRLRVYAGIAIGLGFAFTTAMVGTANFIR